MLVIDAMCVAVSVLAGVALAMLLVRMSWWILGA